MEKPDWPKTIGFGAIQLSATTLCWLWSQTVLYRFHYEHPQGRGPAIANFFWMYSWIGIVAAFAFSLILLLAHSKRKSLLYAVTFYFGAWMLVVWIGFCVVAMEIAFVPWTDLRGAHF